MTFYLHRFVELVPVSLRHRLDSDYIWVTPLVALLIGLTVFPLLFLFYISFHIWSLTNIDNRHYYGLDNYEAIFTDPRFIDSLITTTQFALASVAIELVVGTIIALFLHYRVPDRWQALLQSTFLIPMMMAYVAVGLLWRFMWTPSIGFINYFLTLLNLPTQTWLGDPQWALGAIVVADVWQWTPFVTLIVLSGLQGLPDGPFEAAVLDGANRFQIFRHITFPLLKPILFIAALFRTADAFRIFAKVYVMTGGGPVDSTQVLSVLIYYVSFRNRQLGLASTMSVVMVVILLGGATIAIRRARKTGVI